MYTYRCSVLRSSKKSILIRFNFSFNPVHLARPITSTTYKQGKVFSKQVSIQNAVFLPRHLVCQNQNVRTMLWYFLYFFYYEFPMREVGGAAGKLMFYNRCKYVSCTTRPNKPLGIMLQYAFQELYGSIPSLQRSQISQWLRPLLSGFPRGLNLRIKTL